MVLRKEKQLFETITENKYGRLHHLRDAFIKPKKYKQFILENKVMGIEDHSTLISHVLFISLISFPPFRYLGFDSQA